MKKILSVLFFTCVYANAYTQVNFVKNPSFEKYDTCPYKSAQMYLAKNWQNTVTPNFIRGAEFYNVCATGNIYAGCPNNGAFYQSPHFGNGMVGTTFYYDKTPPSLPPPSPYDNRLYLHGFLNKSLTAGKTYCVSFWVNLMEASGYAHNMIGAYLDDGSINGAVDSAGEAIYSVTPQIYSVSVLSDTMNWMKVEGSFTATGNEANITIGNFATSASMTTIVTNYWHIYEKQSAYLIDDVSVIPIDLAADAGKDTWVEVGKQIQIGRVGDTTAEGLDCKWYHKGVLIDSGAIITVNANAIKNAVDTYVVVQTICGLVKTDTVTVKTAGLGVAEYGFVASFTVYPNPCNGILTITSSHPVIPSKEGALNATLYDLLGRVIYQQQLTFTNNESKLNPEAPNGSYILELQDEKGNVQRERIVIE